MYVNIVFLYGMKIKYIMLFLDNLMKYFLLYIVVKLFGVLTVPNLNEK